MNEKLSRPPPHCHQTQHVTNLMLEDNTLQKYVRKLWTDSPLTVYVEISIIVKISNCICKYININNLKKTYFHKKIKPRIGLVLSTSIFKPLQNLKLKVSTY